MIKDELLMNAKKLHLNTDKKVIDNIIDDWHLIEKDIKLLKSINIDDVKPMTHPVEGTTSYLRGDIPEKAADKKVIIQNAPLSDEDYVLIDKVVKND